ncbi:MAG: MCE family protein [Victivallales bacterium]|nr:MCE family protein [Victivallales bacterium]
MGATSKTTAVGVFVLAAIVLAIVAIVIFGGGNLFEERVRYVIYFEGSVTGLSVGSPVNFRGVKVGSVSDIQVTINNDRDLVRLPVFIDINPKRFSGLSATMGSTAGTHQFISHLVRRGLRAQLVMPSLITGQLAVDLDFYPERRAQYSGVEQTVPELPAIPSNLEMLTKSLKELPLEQMVKRTLHALEGIDELVHSPHLPETLGSLRNATMELDTLLQGLNSHVDPVLGEAREMSREIRELATTARSHVEPLATDMRGLLAAGQQTLATADQTTRELGAKVGEASVAARKAFEQAEKTLDLEQGASRQLVDSLKDTAEAARKTLATADVALSRIDRTLADDSPLRTEALRAMREVASAVRSIQVVAEYLQRHPEALLRGKGKAGER